MQQPSAEEIRQAEEEAKRKEELARKIAKSRFDKKLKVRITAIFNAPKDFLAAPEGKQALAKWVDGLLALLKNPEALANEIEAAIRKIKKICATIEMTPLALSQEEADSLDPLIDNQPEIAESLCSTLKSFDVKVTELAKQRNSRRGERDNLQETIINAQSLINSCARDVTKWDEALKRLKQEDNGATYEAEQAFSKLSVAQNRLSRAEQILERAQGKMEGLDAADRDVEARLETLGRNKKILLDAARFGPLSRLAAEAVSGADEEAAAKRSAAVATILDHFNDHPELALDALDLVRKVEHPDEVANGLLVVGELASKGFQHVGRNESGDLVGFQKDISREIARNALQMGGLLGHPYVEEMKLYYATPPQPDSLLDEQGKTIQEPGKRGVAVTRDMAQKLFVNGQVDFGPTNTALDETVKNLKYHPTSLLNPLFAVVGSLEDLRGKFTGPDKEQYQAALDSVTAPSQQATDRETQTAKKLVADSLGLKKDEQGKLTVPITDLHAKQAVMSALLTPLAQGDVGSCFATGPVLKFKEERTLDYLKDLKQIVGEGKLGRPPQIPNIPVTTELPDRNAENPLSRSHEYTVATLGACVKNAQEMRNLGQSLTGTPLNSFGRLVTAKQRRQIEANLAEKFSFAYLPEEPIGDVGADGSSTKGSWALMVGETKITRKEDFFAELKKVTREALGDDAGPNTTLGNQLDDLCDPANDTLANDMLARYNRDPDTPDDKKVSPWKMGGGSSPDGAIAVLFGDPPGQRPITTTLLEQPLPNTNVLVTNKAEVLLSKLVEEGGPDKKKVTVSAQDLHVMNFLPANKTLLALKGDQTETTAEKIQKKLVEPGQKLAGKQSRDAATYLQNRAVEALIGDFPEGLKAMSPPTAPMTPREIMDNLLARVDGEIQARVQHQLQEFLKTALKNHAVALQKHNQDSENNSHPGPAPTIATLKEKHEAGLIDAHKNGLEKKFSRVLMKEMAPPEVVIADTNWGGPAGRVFHLLAPDPLDGALKLWKRTEPGGECIRESPNWLEIDWTKSE